MKGKPKMSKKTNMSYAEKNIKSAKSSMKKAVKEVGKAKGFSAPKSWAYVHKSVDTMKNNGF